MTTYRDALRQKMAQAAPDHSLHPRLKNMRSSFHIGRLHPVMKMIGKHFDPKNYDNPRCNLIASRILVWSLPFLRRAVELHAEFLGRLSVATDIPALKEMLDSFIRDVPIVNQANPEFKLNRGLNNYAKMRLMTALEDGLTFAEELYDEEQPGLNGLTIIPSDRFDFKCKFDRDVLVYRSTRGREIEIEPSPHFHIFGTSWRPGALWGLQLIEGGHFFGEFLIRVLVSRLKLHSRFGNPPSLDVFILEDSEGFQDEDYEEFKKRTDDVQQDLVNAQQASEEGKSAAVVARMGGKVRHEHSLYGDGATGVASFDKEYELLSRQLALITKIPVEFLGFTSGGAGIGSDKFVVMNGILGAKVEDYREQLRPELTLIMQNHLIAMGAPPAWLEAFSLTWTELDTNDEKAIADTEQVKATTFMQHLNNIATGLSEGTMTLETAQIYLNMNGLEWLELPDELPVPEPPAPNPNPSE